jgi:hypothetical protein
MPEPVVPRTLSGVPAGPASLAGYFISMKKPPISKIGLRKEPLHSPLPVSLSRQIPVKSAR